jgi:hypothetical protein
MPRNALASAVLALALIAGACSSTDEATTGPATTVAGDVEQWVVTLDGDAGSAGDGEIVLAVGESDTVTLFTDRPERQVGRLSAGELVEAWPTAFGDDPPNAALVASVDGTDEVAIVEVSNPVWRDGQLVLAFESDGEAAPSTEFDSFALFVDAVATTELKATIESFPR